MRESLKTGLCFGVTSGIITTLGLMVGLHSGTGSKMVVLGGIITIAIADAFSDALGIHISEESEGVHTSKEVWASTLSTFFSKFLFAMTFVLPVILMDVSTAVFVSIIWGLSVLILLSIYIARSSGKRARGVVAEHLVIAIAVIFITHAVGDWIGETFR